MAETLTPQGDLLASLRAQHAASVEVEVDRVALVRMDLDALLKLGTLVTVKGQGLSMFSTRANWAELGVPETALRRARFTEGVKDLVPKPTLNRFRSLYAGARTHLGSLAFDPDGFWPWKWVPFTAYRKWHKEFKERVVEWQAAKRSWLIGLACQACENADLFIAHFPDGTRSTFQYRSGRGYVDGGEQGLDALAAELACGVCGRSSIHNTYLELVRALEADFTQIGREAWTALQSASGELHNDEESFVCGLVGRARARMPGYREVVEGLTLDYLTGALVSPTSLEEEFARRDQIRHARELESTRAHAEQDAAYAQARMAQLELQQKEQLLGEMREAEMAHYRGQLQTMTSPITDIFRQLRARMCADAQAVLSTMQSHEGNLTGPAARRAKGMIKTFRLLNALDDQDLEGLLDQMSALLSDKPAERDDGAVERVLTDIANLTSESAADLELQFLPGRWGALRPWALAGTGES